MKQSYSKHKNVFLISNNLISLPLNCLSVRAIQRWKMVSGKGLRHAVHSRLRPETCAGATGGALSDSSSWPKHLELVFGASLEPAEARSKGSELVSDRSPKLTSRQETKCKSFKRTIKVDSTNNWMKLGTILIAERTTTL